MTGETVATLAAVAAALFAGYQLRQNAVTQRRIATFQHLREIDNRLKRVWTLSVPKTVAEIKQAYSSGAERLSPDAADYLSLVNALELLSLEIQEGGVEGGIAEDVLRTICRKGIIDSKLVRSIQDGWDDDRIYQHLLENLDHFESSEE